MNAYRDWQRTVNTVFSTDDFLQCMVSLGTNLHGLGERSSTGGQKHKLLEGELVSSVRSTVDNVECRARQDKRRLDTSEVGKVLIERNTLFGGPL